jgi:pSer/pThr/pTyr-binding forkhead associated (FHA) protein
VLKNLAGRNRIAFVPSNFSSEDGEKNRANCEWLRVIHVLSAPWHTYCFDWWKSSLVGKVGSLVADGQSTLFVLQLLDSALGRPVQRWECGNFRHLRIGRSPENEISLTDPQVSRLHVELTYQDGQWHLISHGRNGTWIRGSRVERTVLANRAIFQLGSSGPMLQLIVDSSGSEVRSATIDSFDPKDFDFLEVDQQQLAAEVTRIAESDAFQKLQDTHRQIVDRCSSETGDPDETGHKRKVE